MVKEFVDWLKESVKTRRGWGILLTAFVPIALVIGRAVADYAVSITAILFLIESFRLRQWDWAKKLWIVAALLLWYYSVVRAAFIPDKGVGLYEAFVWLRYIVFAACASEWCLTEEKGRLWLVRSSMVATVFLSLDGIVQYIMGKDILGHGLLSNRLTATYTKPLLGMTITNLFAAPIFWLLKQKAFLKSIAVADLCFAAVYLSGDRMGLVFASIIMLAWLWHLMVMQTNRWKFAGAAVCLFATLVFLAPHITQRDAPPPSERQIQSTAATVKQLDSSPYGLVWTSAVRIAQKYPFFGIGMRQFRKVCPDQRFGPPSDPKTGYFRCYTHPHNAYMEWLAEGGGVGFLGFIGFVVAVFIGLVRRLRGPDADPVLWGLAVMIAVRLMPLFVSTSFFHNWSAIPFWLALGWAMSYKPVGAPQRWFLK